MRRTFSFFIGATIGGLVGATVALLFAPSSGQEFRFIRHPSCDQYEADRASGEIGNIAISKIIKLIILQLL